GRPSTLKADDALYLEEILHANLTLYLDELQSKLQFVREVYVSLVTISHAMVQLQLSQKKLTKVAAERDEQLHMIWEADMAQYKDPDVFVALDESAVDNRTIQRTHGQ
ncbi:hypothetical protein B0H17DRAFT_859244, partial [Mycena rosella]